MLCLLHKIISGLWKPTISIDIVFFDALFLVPFQTFNEDPDGDPDHSQNLITSSFTNFSHILKISSKSLHKFLSYLSLKIKFHGSRRSRKWSESLPKSLLPFTISDISWKFYQNPSISFWVILFTNKETNKQTDGQTQAKT